MISKTFEKEKLGDSLGLVCCRQDQITLPPLPQKACKISDFCEGTKCSLKVAPNVVLNKLSLLRTTILAHFGSAGKFL